MARLNDAPQPAVESIDALKRRFVRQNREIAKANSTQSLRIRTLEGEISRLLAENVSLREQIIHLHYEVESYASKSRRRHGQVEPSTIDDLRQGLEAKLREVGELVASGLEQIREDAARRTSSSSPMTKARSKRRSIGDTITGTKKSPDQRQWKNSQTLGEVTHGSEIDDGRLPVILEDKHYPRETLDTEQLRGVLSDAGNVTDSPEIGPPPIAHFEDPDRYGSRESSKVKDQDGPAVNVAVNSETRKKRRESMSTQQRETLRAANLVDEVTADESSTNREISASRSSSSDQLAFKAGAKRKLSVRDREDGEHSVAANTSQEEGFRFSRRHGGDSDKSILTSDNQATNVRRGSTDNDDMRIRPAQNVLDSENSVRVGVVRGRPNSNTKKETLASSGRTALAPKSTNIDPQSPAKTRRGAHTEKDSIAQVKDIDLAASDRAPPRTDLETRSRPRSAVSSSKSRSHDAAIPPATASTSKTSSKSSSISQPITSLPEPATPHSPPLDLFSPTEASADGKTASIISRGDTPPPSELLGGTNPTSSFGRTSRRARGTSVSYAEPNLRDKMRRPGKELVDAVAVAQSSNLKSTSASKRGTVFNTEADSDYETGAKTDPGSPLGNKHTSRNAIHDARTSGNDIEISLSSINVSKPSTASTALATLISSTSTTTPQDRAVRSSLSRRSSSATNLKAGLDESNGSSIYDFTGGSTPPSSGTGGRRRHSVSTSAGNYIVANEKLTSRPVSAAGMLPPAAPSSGSSTAVAKPKETMTTVGERSRRRQTSTSTSTSMTASATAPSLVSCAPDAGVRAIRGSKSSVHLNPSSSGGSGTGTGIGAGRVRRTTSTTTAAGGAAGGENSEREIGRERPSSAAGVRRRSMML